MKKYKGVLVVACAVIYNPETDEFLLGQRAAHKHNGNFWEFMGGKKDPEDESIQAAIEREIKEEIGVTGKAGEILKVITHQYENAPLIELNFIEFTLNQNTTINPDPAVYQKVDWIKRQHLLDLNLSEGDKLFAETLVGKK